MILLSIFTLEACGKNKKSSINVYTYAYIFLYVYAYTLIFTRRLKG